MEYGYLVSPGVQIHHEVLGLGVSVAHLALVAVGVPGHALGHVPVVIMIMIIVIMIIVIMIIVIMIVVMIGIMILMMIVILILMMIVVMIVMMIEMIAPVVLVLGDELVALVTLWARPGL